MGEASRRFSLESSTFYDVRDGAWSGPATPHCWKRRWLVLEEQMPVEMGLSGRLVATNPRTAEAVIVLDEGEVAEEGSQTVAAGCRDDRSS